MQVLQNVKKTKNAGTSMQTPRVHHHRAQRHVGEFTCAQFVMLTSLSSTSASARPMDMRSLSPINYRNQLITRLTLLIEFQVKQAEF